MPNFWEGVFEGFTNESNGNAVAEKEDAGTEVMDPPVFEPTANTKDGFTGLNDGPRSLSKCLYVEGLSTEEIEIELIAIDKWVAENSGSDKISILKQSKAELEKEKKYRETYDEVTDKPHKQKNLKGDQGEMTRLMLKKVGYDDPKKWYDEMVSINFFGQQAKGIRPEFGKQLKEAEKATLDKLGKEDPKLKDPRRAADYMGINEKYKTSRIFKPEKLEYQSMHLFGLAIDINFVNNPWVTMQGAEPKDTKQNKKDFRDLVKKIDGLFKKDTNADYKYVDANTKIEDNEEMEGIYDGYSGVDKQIEAYAKLYNDSEKLEGLLKGNTHEEWAGLTVEEAREKINVDMDFLAGRSGRYKKFNLHYRGDKTEVHGGETMREEGIMDLDKRLVMSMHESGLDWGGKYGDMMHFDMRFTGIGNKVHRAKNNSEVKALKKKLQAERKAKREAAKAAKSE